MKNKKVWFITGCSSGFGRSLAEQLLVRGEKVVATARKLESISGLKTKTIFPDQLLLLKLDVTSQNEINHARDTALAKFSRIDVLVNNAGYGSVGALEEVSHNEIKRVFETNVFGLIEVTRAFLPQMRLQKSGHILNLSSVAGMVSLPGAGIYGATKFAVEGISEALAGELAPFGIKVILIEPGGFRTHFADRSLSVAPYHPAYDEVLASTRNYYETIAGNQPGDPDAAVKVMIELVDHPNPPLRLPMGKIALGRIHKKIDQYQDELKNWEKVILSTDYPEYR